jgi:very-short-patch-repair endonuclease
MSEIDESHVINEYKNNKSTYEIARDLNTYPNKIRRILKRNGYDLRDKSEAQSLAIKNGIASHPTLGRQRTEQEKNSISNGVYNRWKSMSEEDRANISKNAKDRWDKIPENKRQQMQEMAGRALRQASIDGSKAEKSLSKNLRSNGYEVVLHKKNLIPGNYEIDLFLPEIKTVIEIDGPQHFRPVWGEEQLKGTIRFDQIKNGLLLSNGYCVIRIKYLCPNWTRILGKKLWELVKPHVDNISQGFPKEGHRFIELEILND